MRTAFREESGFFMLRPFGTLRFHEVSEHRIKDSLGW